MVSIVNLQSINGNLSVGGNAPVRVNCSVGINSEVSRTYEIERLETIKDSDCLPDTFMDLSVGCFDKPFYQEIQYRFNCPVGFVPSYLFPLDKGISKEQAIDIIKRLADDGIAFITLHLTASLAQYKLAKAIRRIPVTSRGGGVVLHQMMMTGSENIWRTCLPEITEIVKQYHMAISLGATFRPAGIADACDEVHLSETEEQLKLCRMLQAESVQVMVENVGHIAIDQLEQHCRRLREFNVPIMPLGPTPTDCALGTDHIVASIGATFMGYWGCAHIINCITRAEHTNSTFTIDETLEAIRSARVAAHIVDVARGMEKEQDKEVYEQRAKAQSCLAGRNDNCSRCSVLCPLKMNKQNGTRD